MKTDFRWFIKSLKIKEKIESYPVDLCFHFHFKSRAFDSSNCSFMSKMIEDALVKEGILTDDSIKYVGTVLYKAFKGKENRVVLHICKSREYV